MILPYYKHKLHVMDIFQQIYSNPVSAEYAAAGTYMPKHARR